MKYETHCLITGFRVLNKAAERRGARHGMSGRDHLAHRLRSLKALSRPMLRRSLLETNR